jgi:ADP-ribosylglycohydrolase
LVEFSNPQKIASLYPNGVREITGGGPFNTLAGQPTDDSEMALILAKTLLRLKTYESNAVFQAYLYWLETNPFDCGETIMRALTGQLNPLSQANGVLMRISPLGIFGAFKSPSVIWENAIEEALLTHPHKVCQDTSALFVSAISQAIREGLKPKALYQSVLSLANERRIDPSVLLVLKEAANRPPDDYVKSQGWALIAFQNAFWQLLHSPNYEEALVDTVGHGGDTDTNAAIAGALLGAVHGLEAIPKRWVVTVLNCRPEKGLEGVYNPRPEIFWPKDALPLAAELLGGAN